MKIENHDHVQCYIRFYSSLPFFFRSTSFEKHCKYLFKPADHHLHLYEFIWSLWIRCACAFMMYVKEYAHVEMMHDVYIYILIFGRFWDCIVLVSSWFRRIYIAKTISAESQHTTHSRSEDQPIVLMGCLLSESCQTEWNCDWFFRQCGDDSHTMTDQLRRKQSASDPLDSRPVSAIKNWAGAMHRRAYTMAVTCNSSINNRSGENGAVG